MTAYLDTPPRDFDTAAAEAEAVRAGKPARDKPLTDDEADEALRLNEGGLFLPQLGALFRRDYAVISKALAAARKRRADLWARQEAAPRIPLPKRYEMTKSDIARGVGGAAAREQGSAE